MRIMRIGWEFVKPDGKERSDCNRGRSKVKGEMLRSIEPNRRGGREAVFQTLRGKKKGLKSKS